MDNVLRKWEAAMQSDTALKDRLQRLNPEGYPATKKGDLVALKVKSEKKPIVVSWDSNTITVERRQPKNAFMVWSIDGKKFKDIFLSGKFPPLLVAMNNDQKNVKAACDHHNGSICLSCMVMLQDVTEGGGKR
ncbi:MAG: hypothetical protein GY868_14590 [Deltaproteobacteria bacterium]|nr:hypothetical protein [Deltaproteobacteria bacterium]